ncbi:8-amino-7-oxononanoate synthase [Hahella sp. KA22]|uniref:8-amino-7-oxononanoate synthase n=1 Tax=Hahella sp. KA22 TaxID=1628392 RepID=UPI000FDF0022|nr:8-amino-7-oxononanoate synthase [Hahella sp. KA22]AZZ90815.1 8-amino-7-oxononanoate synthase [Hahella sp. KA22]QAY54185.1 8-amino-7-oxononanoate synthase [Hahella sp. KA22]
MSKWGHLAQTLAARKQQALYRSRLTIDSPQAPRVMIEGREYLAFCSNDYLGLANDPRVIAAAQQALSEYGLGGGASHLVIGHHRAHHELELDLAEFTGRDRALLFSTGYMANLGVASALLSRGDYVIEDKLNHASLLDAGILSGAKLLRYRHADSEHLASRLDEVGDSRALVITDGVFSMDGDIAPLDVIARICHSKDAMLMVDDAHGFGVLGAEGGGCAAHFGLNQSDIPILMGTLGKSYGAAGAFVAGPEELIETLVQFARTYIYTTSMPPAIAAATRVSLRISREESWRRERLNELVVRFRKEAIGMGYQLEASSTPIQPILIGDAATAMELSQALRQEGILITAIRPPTVPANTSRLRVTFSAAHTDDDLNQLLEVLYRYRGAAIVTGAVNA